MNRKIIVTGANGNLGVSVVRHFLEHGDHIIAVGRGFQNLSFAKTNQRYEEHVVDLMSEKSISDFGDLIFDKHKIINAAFFLVGGFAMGKIQQTSMQSIKEMVALNFETAYNISRNLFEKMATANGGQLVFIGAKAALEAKQGKNMLAYTLSKSLLFKWAELLNEEGKGKNIVSSVVVPGIIDTPANRGNMPGANVDHWVKPGNIAALLDFISSEPATDLREMVYKIYNES